MKGKRGILVGLALGVIIGYALGFLRLPFIGYKDSFWLGLVVGIVICFFILLIIFTWNKKGISLNLNYSNSLPSGHNLGFQNHRVIRGIAFTFLTVVSIASSFIFYKQHKLIDAKTNDQSKYVQEHTQLIESVLKSSRKFIMSELLNKINKELEQHPERKLSNETITELSELSLSFQPYEYYARDSVTNEKLSPERGQLLLALCSMDIDSSSFSTIKRNVTFSKADLRGVSLKGKDLSSINLDRANLSNADLRGVNFSGANMEEANLWHANFNEAVLEESNLSGTDLRWAELNNTNMKLSYLKGADLTNAKLREADMRNANFQWAVMNGAMLNKGLMVGADLSWTKLIKVNLSSANLTESRLRTAELRDANMIGTILDKVAVGEDWLKNIFEWQIRGAEEILKDYDVIKDSSDRYKNEIYFLIKKEV